MANSFFDCSLSTNIQQSSVSTTNFLQYIWYIHTITIHEQKLLLVAFSIKLGKKGTQLFLQRKSNVSSEKEKAKMEVGKELFLL
jgi:hypothetical protein